MSEKIDNDKFTILAVDDQSLNQEFIQSFLAKRYSIKSVFSGKGALKVLEKFKIDLILLDIEMPEMSGFECAKLIKQNPLTKDIPIIFLTSHQDKEYTVKGFKLGANDYITKPFNFEELRVRVENQLKTFQLLKKLETAYSNLEKFIDTQDNIVLLTDGVSMKFANRKFFEFFNFKNIEEFKRNHNCICEFFLENDRFFHLGRVESGENWLDVISEFPQSKRVVSILDSNLRTYLFSISINNYDESTSIVSFTDISQTMIEQLLLEKKIVHDNLTKAYNREFFEKNYKRVLKEYHIKESKLAIALLDIDHFKLVNDIYGHDIGDEVLVKFVEIIDRYSREDDILIRWGGEEFILILKVPSKEALKRAIEHLRGVVEIQKFPKIGQKTCSIGATIYQNSEDIENTIKRADEALYIAKNSGRNRVALL